MNNKIDIIIVDNFKVSRDFLLSFFGISPGVQNFGALEPYVKLLAALRALPPAALEDIARPLLENLFSEMGFDPRKDRLKAAPYVDMFALYIQDSVTLLIQNMEHQNQAQAALRSGRGSMLI